MKRVPAVACDVCNKPVSRLLGFAAIIRLTTENDRPLTRVRTSARGFCLAHRDQIAPRFMADAHAEGEVLWQAPEPLTLRPDQVVEFQTDMDALARDAGHALGIEPSAGWRELHALPGDGADLPDLCPHCNGRLSWGTGPHVRDAANRKASGGLGEAWECLDCRAAGILTGRLAD